MGWFQGVSSLSVALPLDTATSYQRLAKAPLTQDNIDCLAKRTAASCKPAELVIKKTVLGEEQLAGFIRGALKIAELFTAVGQHGAGLGCQHFISYIDRPGRT
jgi:hypothetical protein